MTNEEKAREIANEYCYWDDRDESGAVKVAIEMAEWKDHQLRDVKDAFIAFCHNIINGMYVSVEAAAKEQLEYLEDAVTTEALQRFYVKKMNK